MIYCATEELEIEMGACCSSVFLGLPLGDFEIANLAARHAIAAFPNENPRLTSGFFFESPCLAAPVGWLAFIYLKSIDLSPPHKTFDFKL